MIILDTHVVHWLAADEHKIGRRARELIEQTDPTVIHISAVTFWELGQLIQKGRLEPMAPGGLAGFRAGVEAAGFQILNLDLKVVFASDGLTNFHADPGDRFIAGTALVHQLALVTADRKILAWSGSLKRIDART